MEDVSNNNVQSFKINHIYNVYILSEIINCTKYSQQISIFQMTYILYNIYL